MLIILLSAKFNKERLLHRRMPDLETFPVLWGLLCCCPDAVLWRAYGRLSLFDLCWRFAARPISYTDLAYNSYL